MKKRMSTVNSTFILKYIHESRVCMCHEEIRTSTEVEHVDVYKHTLNIHIIILLHMYVCCVQYTALDSTSCGRTITCSNKYGVLRRKVVLSPSFLLMSIH